MDTCKHAIVGHVQVKGIGTVPILGIRMMSDEREKELAAQSAKKWEEASQR